MRFIDRQQLIIFIVAVMLFVGFGLFRYYPLIKQKSSIENLNDRQMVAVARAKTYGLQLPLLRRHIAAVRDKTKNYDAKIPESRQFAELWQQFASVMNKHNLEDQLVQPATEIKGSEVNCIPLNIECSGSLRQIFELFRSMQEFERLIRIESVKLINDKEFKGRLKMKAQASVYYCSTGAKSI